MVDQATIDRVAAALEGADIGHSMSLTRLLDGVHTYTLKIRGEIETFIDNDEADAIDQVYTRIREVKHRLQAEAVIAALNPTPAPEIAALRAENERLRGVLATIIEKNQEREFMGDDASDGYGNQGWVVRDGQYARIARAAVAPEQEEAAE
jgi:hypothetical protein